MKNNCLIPIVMLGILFNVPIDAKSSTDAHSHNFHQASELDAHIYTTRYLDNALSWTDQKINDLKQSIRKHPWRYLAGFTAAAALIGISIYALKMKHVAGSSAIPLPQLPIEPIVPAIAKIPVPVAPVSPVILQQTPKQFLLELRNAVEVDLFRVECLMGDRMHGITDLESVKQITTTNYAAELHAGLKKIKDAFVFLTPLKLIRLNHILKCKVYMTV